MKQEKIDEIIIEIYQELFSNSTPKGNFKKMIESGETKQEQFFLKYQCDENKQTEIIDRILNKYKVKGLLRRRFEKTIVLGCSPKF